MNKLSIKCLGSAMAFIAVLTACTTKVEISLSETRIIDTLNDNFRPVETQKIVDTLHQRAADAEGGFVLIELASKTDLEKIIREKEMAFLYYELRPCDGAKGSSELYSAPAYINAQAASSEADNFHYYAPVPQDYPDEIGRYQAMLGKVNATLPTQICIGLGAGNMAGQTLTTNFVLTELGR